MKYDSDTDTGNEPLTVAGDVDNMTQAVKAPKAKPAKKAAAKAKKPAKAKAKAKAKKPAKKVAKKTAKKAGKKTAKKTNGKPHGAQTETVLTLLKKGVTRAELLAKLGWNAINVYQFVPKTKLVVAKTEGVRGLTYRMRK